MMSKIGGKTVYAVLVAALVLTACSETAAEPGAEQIATESTIQSAKPTASATPSLAEKSIGQSSMAFVWPEIVVYKSPTCGCCSKWVTHLEEAGFKVRTEDHENMTPIKQSLGVPPNLASCHTAKVGDYVVEGHVPADDVKRLLEEKPEVSGLTVPGMPLGSPGMEHPRPQHYATLTFSADGTAKVFARHGPETNHHEGHTHNH